MFSIPYDETGETTRIVRAGMFVIIFFLGGFLAWSYLAPISGAVIAEGNVKVSGKRKTIQHLDGGVVRELKVHEGQYVEAGQVLIVLEDSAVRSNLAILTDQLNLERAREARLLAEKKLQNRIDFPGELIRNNSEKVKEILANETALFQTKKKSLDEQIAVLHSEISHARDEERDVNNQIGSVSESIRYKRERVASGEALNAQQFLEKNQLLQLKEDLSQTQANLNQLHSQLSSLKQRQNELELRIINLRNDYARQADSELKEAMKAIYETEEKIAPAKMSLERSQITAPISGQVIDLKVTTIGGVVRSGDPLMDIVPIDNELIVEVKIRTRDISKVQTGQRSDMHLLAYSQRSVPHIEGTVIYLSEDALPPQQNEKEPYFLAYVQVDEHALDDLPNVHLTPGMPVTAFIQTKPTTLVNILMKPMLESLGRGVRRQTD